ncbi:MAG: Fur family transcriptional regulator [Rhizonema sp. PD37]|nr:Fur family transcriptional regulator [Rhizonema sp. PD37]
MVKIPPATDVIQRLQSKGLKVTPQRAAVYANLLSRSDHPTVEEILSDLNSDLPVSSKATIYTALTALREVGLVREVLLSEGVTRYDANIDQHHHFRCRACGGINDLAWEMFKAPQLQQLNDAYKVESYEVTVCGLCPSCAKSNLK